MNVHADSKFLGKQNQSTPDKNKNILNHYLTGIVQNAAISVLQVS